MIRCFEERRAAAVIAFEEVPRSEVHQYGVAAPRNGATEIFEIADLVEKPSADEAPSNLAIAARYVFAPSIFDALQATPPGKGGEIQLTDAIRALIRQGAPAYGVRLGPGETRYDIGNFESYFQAFVEFALNDPRFGRSLRRHIKEHLLDADHP
jgi:UTP--glucose-1-phosphate uridylyltransferase